MLSGTSTSSTDTRQPVCCCDYKGAESIFALALLHQDVHMHFLIVRRDIVQEQASPELIRMGRNCAINQVLGTDMKKHFDIVSRFQVCATSPHDPLPQPTLFA